MIRSRFILNIIVKVDILMMMTTYIHIFIIKSKGVCVIIFFIQYLCLHDLFKNTQIFDLISFFFKFIVVKRDFTFIKGSDQIEFDDF